jgi:hypothetical protein
MKLPSREEIRRKYGISERDFAILTTSKLPSLESLRQEGARIERLGFWDRYEVWKKQTITGTILSVLIVIGDIFGGVTALYYAGSFTYTTLAPYVRDFSPHTIVASIDLEGHRAFPPTQPHNKREKWAVLQTTAGIQANSITPSSGLS